MRELQQVIGAWSRERFPQQSAARLYRHLVEETGELGVAVDPSGVDVRAAGEEIADCLILLLCLADYLGIDGEQAVRAKHEVNKRRVYRYDPALGYDRKVEPDAA